MEVEINMIAENKDWIFDGIGAALIILLITWAIPSLYKFFLIRKDGQKIYDWLFLNTKDEPHQSHKSLIEISIGTRIPEDRVKKACLNNWKIFQSIHEKENYSIWRVEPKSIYETRGMRSI